MDKQASRFTLIRCAFHGLMGFRWANYARKARFRPLHPPPASPRSRINSGCQTSACHLGVFTEARIIHPTLLETLTNPAIASRQRETRGRRKGQPEEGRDGMGQRGKRRGLTGLPCCRMKDATTWKTVAARVHARPPPPLLAWKGLFFIIQNIQSFKLWKTAAVIRIIGPLYSPRIRSVTNNGFSKFNSPR